MVQPAQERLSQEEDEHHDANDGVVVIIRVRELIISFVSHCIWIGHTNIFYRASYLPLRPLCASREEKKSTQIKDQKEKEQHHLPTNPLPARQSETP